MAEGMTERARKWLISGGNGFEGGEDGIRAHSCSGESLVEYLAEFGKYVESKSLRLAEEIASDKSSTGCTCGDVIKVAIRAEREKVEKENT